MRYKVQRDGKVAFLKALDYSKAEEIAQATGIDTLTALQSLINAYQFERNLLQECRQKRMDRIVVALEELCVWSGMKCHPDDLRTCQLTHVTAHFEFMTTNGQIRLEPLVNLLNGLRRKTDKQELWPTIAANMSQILDARSQVEAAVLSPSGEHLAVCLETKNWLGLKTRQAGLLYAIRDHEVVGRIVTGKRGTEVWGLEKII